MSRRENAVRLRHMLDAARKATEYVGGKTRNDLDSDEKLTLAIVRLLEIIGEAARSVSWEVREKHPEIAWKEIVGARDRLIHGYFEVDLNIVWQIVTGDLPFLILQLEKILGDELHPRT